MKVFWFKRRRVDANSGELSGGFTDADILRSIRASLQADAQQRDHAHEQQFLREVKESIALRAYLTGEASLEDVRPHLKCEQCVRILELGRKQWQGGFPPAVAPGQGGGQPLAADRGPARLMAEGRRVWFHTRANWKPLTIGATACLLTLALFLVVLPWLSPNANAILRFVGPPKPIVREHGRLADKVNRLLLRSAHAIYLAPSDVELKAIQQATELITLSLKLRNDTVLAEATKAADRAGYAIVKFEDNHGLKAIVLQEKPDHNRGRGTFFFRREHYDGRLIIVAPHALRDEDTGRLGTECFSRIPGADAFFLSGAQSSYIDEAHAEHTIFNAVFRATMGPQAICLSLHGFDEKKPGRADYPDVIITSGAVTEPLVQRVHTALCDEMSKFVRVGIYEGKRFADVAATTDQQGIFTSSVNSLFVHLEFNHAVRFNPTIRDQLIGALQGVLGNVNAEIIARYAQPSRNTLIRFATVAKVPMNLLVKYGHNTVLMSRRRMRRLRLRSGDLALASHGQQYAVTRVYPYDGSEDRIYLTGAMRRRLGVNVGAYQVQISQLPK